jgi:hypothetical protein
MAGMNPQMLMQLMAQAGGQGAGSQLGPESLLAILSSLGLGHGQGAPGGGTPGGINSSSLSTLLPQLLAAMQQQGGGMPGLGGGQPQQPQQRPQQPQQGQGQQQNPAMSVLQMLGMVRR